MAKTSSVSSSGLKRNLEDFFSNNSKKLLIAAAVFSGIAIVVTIGIWWMFKDYDPNVVAVVGGTSITRSQYDSEVAQCKAGQKFDGGKSSDDCNQTAISNLVYLEKLRADAVTYGINVSQVVETKYKELAQGYESEDIFLRTYRDQFAEGPVDIKRNLETQALEEALSDKLIAKMNLIGAYVRWDNFSETDGENVAKQNATALVSKYLVDSVKTGTEVQINVALDKLRKENPKYDNQTKSLAGFDRVDGVNQTNYPVMFTNGDKDWQEMKSLTKVGDTTEVFVSPGGSAKLYKLESKTDGKYQSWDDYKAQALKEAKVALATYNINKYVDLVKNFFGAKAALATCSSHLRDFIVSNIVYSGTNISVSHISYDYNQTAGYSGCTAGCSSATCSGSGSSSDASFHVADRNCMTRWNVAFYSQSNTFWPIRYINRGFYSNDHNENMDYDLANHDAYAEVQNNSHQGWGHSYTVNTNDELGNNNGKLYVWPKSFVLTVNISPANAAISTGDGSYKSYDSATASYRSVNSAYEPDYYTVSGSATHFHGSSYTVSPMDQNTTVTFYFKTKSVACSIARFTANGSNRPLTIKPGDRVTFDFAATDAHTTTFTNGDTTSTATTENPHTYNTTGSYVATYTCSGDDGNHSSSIAVTVSAGCSVSGATADKTAGDLPLDVNFDGHSANTYLLPMQYLWDFKDGITRAWGSTIPASHQYLLPGSYGVELRGRLTDGTDCGISTTPVITVTTPPAISCNVSPSSGLSPLTVKVDFTTQGTSLTNIFMNYGESNPMAQGVKPSPFYFTYNDAGSYSVHATGPGVPDAVCTVTTGKDNSGNPIKSVGPVVVGSQNSGGGGEVNPGH